MTKKWGKEHHTHNESVLFWPLWQDFYGEPSALCNIFYVRYDCAIMVPYCYVLMLCGVYMGCIFNVFHKRLIFRKLLSAKWLYRVDSNERVQPSLDFLLIFTEMPEETPEERAMRRKRLQFLCNSKDPEALRCRLFVSGFDTNMVKKPDLITLFSPFGRVYGVFNFIVWVSLVDY